MIVLSLAIPAAAQEKISLPAQSGVRLGGDSQARAEPVRIGILAWPIPGVHDVLASFKNAMTRLGHVDGRGIVYEERVRNVVGAVGLTGAISHLRPN